MNEVIFVEQREPDWKRLTYLTEKADASPSNLSGEELLEFVRLYRKSSADLALVRTKSNNLQLIDHLNDVVGRAYSTLYRSRRKHIGAAIADAIALSARTVRKLQWFVLTSVLLFVGAIFFAYFGSMANTDLKDSFEQGPMGDAIQQWKSGVMQERNMEDSLSMTGFYSANNPRVAIIEGSAAAGSFGLLTAYMVWQNGAILGVLAYEMSTVGRLPHLIIWIAPHGVTELSGLILSGAAGFQLGWALIAPGRRRRSVALKEAGKDAIVVLMTAVVLMFMAAPVEGFFSFNPSIPDGIKIAFAVLAAMAWATFWCGYAREPRSTKLEQAPA